MDIQSSPGTHLTTIERIVEAAHGHVSRNIRPTFHNECYAAVIQYPAKPSTWIGVSGSIKQTQGRAVTESPAGSG